jgi:RNA polymerase sigma factor (sigma-70 family)
MSRTHFTSTDLYDECVKGSAEAWNEAAGFVYGILYRNCWRLSKEEIQDLVNETLLYFLSRGLEEIVQPGAFKGLLRLKAKSLAIDYHRKTAAMKIQDPPHGNEENDISHDEHFPPSRDNSEMKIFTNQALNICAFIITSLKNECREILPLYFKYKVTGDGVSQLAEDLNKPLGSIATSVHRCLKKLYSHPQIIMLKEEIIGGLN